MSTGVSYLTVWVVNLTKRLRSWRNAVRLADSLFKCRRFRVNTLSRH